jgi:hypothetical protein
MNILKLNNGKVEIRKDTGSLVRTIGNGDAVFADFNAAQTLVLITPRWRENAAMQCAHAFSCLLYR